MWWRPVLEAGLPSLVQIKADRGLRVLLEQPHLIAFTKTHANQLTAFSCLCRSLA